jgi:radical SAM superfamily enzyme YgiQ (UPF0313 family)
MIFINPDSRANRDIPNIGLALAATHYKARVIDLNTMPQPAERFLHEKSELLGISVQSRTYSEALRIKRLYSERYPDAKVKSVNGFIDVQCCYPYLSLEEDMNPGIPFGDDMPFPDYNLFDSVDVFCQNWQKGQWKYAIITTLGCPFSCTYCMASKRKVTMRSVVHCIEELKEAKAKWKIKGFTILDDCFNTSKDRVFEFCRQVAPLNLKWGCANGLRADRFDKDIAKELRASGCDFISFGIESADNSVLKAIRKGETIEQIEGAVSVARKYFPVVNGYFIIGLPCSDYKKDISSLKWALRNNINAHFSYYIPFDRQMYYDSIFYGNEAVPVSDAYEKELQKKIFDMTACMRADYRGGVLKKAINKLFLVFRFSPATIPKFVWNRIRMYQYG